MNRKVFQHTYTSNDDRQTRLHGTYCVYDGHVVFMEYAGDYNFVVTFARSLKRDRETIDIRNEQFSSIPFSLGWVNHPTEGNAYHISRMANRGTRQGVSARSLVVTDMQNRSTGGRDLPWAEVFETCYNNVYPSVTAAIKSLQGTKLKSVAISRTIMIHTDEVGIIKIVFGNETIGWYSRSEGFCRVPEADKMQWYCKFLNPFGLKVESGVDF